MACVYKLNREDNLSYIGVASNFERRLKDHKKSLRFSKLRIISHEILFEGTWEECDKFEEFFIEKYDTYRNGLNCTKRGKGLSECDKFNTLGFVYSEKSRKRMSDSAKLRGSNNKGIRHSQELKEHWSRIRKGKVWGPRKLDESVILERWVKFNPSYSEMKQYTKKSQRDDATYQGELVMSNGRILKKEHVFAEIMAKEYDVTKNGIIVLLERINAI